MKRSILLLITIFLTSISFGQKVEVKDSNNETLITINDEGLSKSSITIQNSDSAPGILTDKLYNVGHLLFWNGSMLGTGGSPVWSLNGSNAYYNAGNVGIGTSTPANKLHLIGDLRMDDASPYMNFYSGTTQMGNIGFWTDNNLNIINRGATSATVFATNGAEKMRITADGNVGIGTTAPTHPLEVIGPDTSGYFQATGTTGVAVYGSAPSTGEVFNTGGYFEAEGEFGRGVAGYASGASGRGVEGFATSTGEVSNTGGYFVASGVFGQGVAGFASGLGGRGVYGSGVQAGVYGKTNAETGRGVEGVSYGTSGIGVHGSAPNPGEVFNTGGYFEAGGEFGRGVAGYASGASGRGVEGFATSTGEVSNTGGYFVASGVFGQGVEGYASGLGGHGVYGSGGSVGVYGKTNAEIGRGVEGISYGTSGIGVFGSAPNPGEVSNTGGHFEAGGTSSRGVYAEAQLYGVEAKSTATSGNVSGGWFEAESDEARAVYGLASATSGTTFGGAFNAASSPNGTGVWASGGQYDFYAGGPGTDYGTSSSKRWKENVVSIAQPLQKVSALRGVYFDWDDEHGGQHDVGFIAEEVGEVLPEIVDYEENGIDAIGLDYSKLSPLLVEAVKALVAENDILKAELKTMKNENKEMNARLDQLEAVLETRIPK